MALSSSNHPSSPPVAAQRQSPAARDRNAENLITYCCVCFLPVASAKAARGDDAKEDLPFWLTSCGHIVCGSHVFPSGVPQDAAKTTHTCPYCNSCGISLADLGAGKVSLELRDYFRPESDLLEDVAGAIKFRMSNAVRIAFHYKLLAEKLQSKLDDQRRVLLKVKDELIEGKELKKKKLIMENEMINLRQEISQLRAQLSSAQLSSLDCDGAQSAQRQYRSSTETLQQNSISPATIVAEIDSQHKRKADDDPAFRAREFRNEMNKRQAMPPPVLPQPVSRIEQYPDHERRERYDTQRQDQNQKQHVDIRSGEYNNQFQKLDYSPQRQQIHDSQTVFRGVSNQHGGQLAYRGSCQQPLRNEHERQFVDLTRQTESSMDPPPPPHPRGGFGQQQRQDGGDNQSRAGYVNNINVPFRSPVRAPTPRPVSSLPVRGVREGYFTSLNQQSPRAGTGYGNTLPQSFRGTNFRSPLSRTEQGGNIYGRGGQEQFTIPSTPRAAGKGSSSVVSPFFADLPAATRNLGLPNIGNGVRRPASVASFGRQQKGLSRSYGGGLGDEGFFIRQDDKIGSFSMTNAQRGSGGGLGGIFKAGGDSATGGRVVDRPGLRRTVRRD